MAAPESRQPRSVPITGRGAARDESLPPQPRDDAADFTVQEDVFLRPTISVPPRAKAASASPAASDQILTDAASPAPPAAEDTSDATTARRSSRPRNLEDRSADSARGFTRLVTRPATSITAHAVVRQSLAEGAIDPDRPVNSSYGKLAGHQQPVYRPNRLSIVLDNIFEKPGLRWLDALGSRWAKLALLLAFFGVIGSAIAWQYFGAFRGSIPFRSATDQTADVVPVETRMERARAAFRGLLASQTVSERLAWVVDPERVRARMTRFYASAGSSDPHVLTWEVGPPRQHGTGSWFPVTFEEPGGIRTTIPIIEESERCRVDWESFVAYGDTPWAAFCSERPTRPCSLRVFLRPGGSAHPDFPQSRFRSYLVEHREGPPQLTAYVPLDGRTAQTLADMEHGTDWFSANVYLAFGDGPAASRPALVSDVIRNRWQDQEVVRFRP